jgi:hypothetical protein
LNNYVFVEDQAAPVEVGHGSFDSVLLGLCGLEAVKFPIQTTDSKHRIAPILIPNERLRDKTRRRRSGCYQKRVARVLLIRCGY